MVMTLYCNKGTANVDIFFSFLLEYSSKRSIQPLLDKYQLQCSLIPRSSFHFDASKYIRDDEDESDVEQEDMTDNIPYAKVDAGGLSSVFMLELSAKN